MPSDTPGSLTEQTEIGVDLTTPCEGFEFEGDRVRHRLSIGELAVDATAPVSPRTESADAKGAWWMAYLHGANPVPRRPAETTLRFADLFCGAGGLTLGLKQLGLEMGVSLVPELIVDLDGEAMAVHTANHGTRTRVPKSVDSLLDYRTRSTTGSTTFVYPPEILDASLAQQLSGIQAVLAGPPCQGHSNLNNHTRRDDPRNDLYLTVPAFAVAVEAPLCIIENVPAILNDSDDVVTQARRLFESSGYSVSQGVLSASAMGWPQTRKRHFMVARRDRPPLRIEEVATVLAEKEPRSVWWAIGDLEYVKSTNLIDRRTELSAENVDRVNWLFDNDEYDLDLPERPKSHRNGTSYQSVYGRLHHDQPAQTITTGFMSPGRGRYVHPTQRRVLTAHEAARLQGFPDSYQFAPNPSKPPSRASLAKWIGDAVPMPLGYAAAITALGNGLPRPDDKA